MPSARVRLLPETLLAILVALLVLAEPFRVPLIDPDEGRYAEIPREMLASGDWVLPHQNGLTCIEKPPLAYWLVAGSYRLFGVNETAARLPGKLATVATMLALFLFARRRAGERAGALAALFFGGSLLGFGLARVVRIDPILTAAQTAAVREPDFLRFYFVREHFERFLLPNHNRPGAWWCFLAVVAGGFLPFTPLLPRLRSIWPGRRRAGWSARPLESFLILWVLLVGIGPTLVPERGLLLVGSAWLLLLGGAHLALPAWARWDGSWPVVTVLRETLRPGDVLLQRGDYVGFLPLYARRLTPLSRIGAESELAFGRSHDRTGLVQTDEEFTRIWNGPRRVLALLHREVLGEWAAPGNRRRPYSILATAHRDRWVLVSNEAGKLLARASVGSEPAASRIR